jgi:branched-chain amino acid transport system substrate-binding protein
MISRLRLRTALVATLGAALLAFGCGGQSGDGLVIGEYGSLTGNDATFGQSTKAGVEIALDELTSTKNGSIGGMAVRSVVEDDQGRPEEAANVVHKLISQDRVCAIIGEVASSRSLAAAPICQDNGIPMISPSSTNPEVTKKGDHIFRMCYLDDFQGEAIAIYAADSLKLKHVAVLKDVKNDYSVALAQFFTDQFKQRGGTVVTEQSYSSGDQDFRAQLTAIKAHNPQAIVIPGYYTEVGLISRQARELGLNVPLLGGDGWESQKLIEIGGTAMNGSFYTNHWSLDQDEPRLQAFVAAYRKKFNSDPDAIAGLAYDAATLLFQSLDKLASQDAAAYKGLASSQAGSPARKAGTDKLRDILASTKDFPGVTGMITMDENRNPKKPIVMIAVKDGKKVYAGTITH